MSLTLKTPTTTTRRPTLKLLLAMACLSLTAIMPAFAAQPTELEPFTATYEASYMGLRGTATMSLARNGSDRWKYSLDIDSALAKLGQHTVFDASHGQWRPLSGTDSSSLLIKRNTKKAVYDWSAREATWSGDVKADRAGPVALQAGDLDAMLLNLAIPRDVAAGKPLDYRMVDDGRAKQMHYDVAGKDTIQIAGKQQPATKVTQTNGDKQTILWVVEGIPVPARILQRKNGKDEMDLTLQSVR